MKIIIIIVLFYSNFIFSYEKVNLFDKRLSQGYVSPVITENNRVVIADKNGTLYSFNIYTPGVLDWKLELSSIKRKTYNMSILCHKELIFFVVDNVIYTIDVNSGKVRWEKELNAPIKGNVIIINNKLFVLTIEDYFYALDMMDGFISWSYQNGISMIRGFYPSVSPVIFNKNRIVVPFSNGKLIAFNENGGILWIKKLTLDLLDVYFTDITTTPKVLDNILIVTNNSYIYGINLKSGKILWSRLLQVKSISNIVKNHNSTFSKKQGFIDIIFIIDTNNSIIGINIKNGEIFWIKNLINNIQLFTIVEYDNILWITSNKNFIFALPMFSDRWNEIKIPGKIFNYPVFINNKIFITTKKNGVYFLKNRWFNFYDSL